MIQFEKLLYVFSLLHFAYVSSQNSKWPQDKSKPFPYPTPGPININTTTAKLLTTPTPLTFKVNPKQSCYVENTGSNLISTTDQPTLATLSGGILYKDTYYFYQDQYYWDLRLVPDAAIQINGLGSPVQAVSTFYNKKYGNLTNAMTKRDGIVEIVVFIYVVGPIPTSNYESFETTVQSVTKAGTKKKALEIDSYNWYFKNSLRNDYYAFPGQYTDVKTGKAYFSSTVIVTPRFPVPILSHQQFYATFGSLRNKRREWFSHKAQIFPAGPRPIVHANGIQLAYT